MAYNSEIPRVEYTASASQTLFSFLFKIYEKTDIVVYQTPVGDAPDDAADILTVDVGYTVAITGDSGGSITLTAGATAGDALTLLRDLPTDRDIDYQTNGDLLAEVINDDQDYQTYLMADQAANNNRFLSLPISSQNVSSELPAPIGDAYLRWKTDGSALENDTTIPQAVIDSAQSASDSEDSNLDAGSWANENEDTAVKEFTSGTPSDRVPTVYSAKHWAIKAQEAVIGDVEFRDTEWRVFDNLDNTKKVAFQVSAIATATVRTITMPDSDVDLGDIGKAGTKEVDETNIADDKILVFKTASGKLEYEEKPVGGITTTSEAQTKIGDLTIGETISVSSWSYSGTTITINTSAIHNLIVGQYFRVSGLVATTNAPNGRWQVASVVDTDTITFTADDTPTGTPTVSSAELKHGDITLNGSFKEFDLGQTWQNVIASRSSGVTYTNNTGKPIMVCVTTGNNGAFDIRVDDVRIDSAYVVTYRPSCSFIVPNGSTYNVLEEISGTLDTWAELR